VKRLSLAQVKAMHGLLIIEIGGVAGIRKEELLDAALIAPFKTFDGEDVYRGLEAKAARLGYGIIKSRPFIYGNEQTGMLAVLTFLLLNGVWLHCSDQDIIDTGLKLKSGEMSQGQLMHWIKTHR
jgi:death-on-curing protein